MVVAPEVVRHFRVFADQAGHLADSFPGTGMATSVAAVRPRGRDSMVERFPSRIPAWRSRSSRSRSTDSGMPSLPARSSHGRATSGIFGVRLRMQMSRASGWGGAFMTPPARRGTRGSSEQVSCCRPRLLRAVTPARGNHFHSPVCPGTAAAAYDLPSRPHFPAAGQDHGGQRRSVNVPAPLHETGSPGHYRH